MCVCVCVVLFVAVHVLHVLESHVFFLTIFFQGTANEGCPPTSLQDMLDAYMEEEQLTSDQWRSVSVSPVDCARAFSY